MLLGGRTFSIYVVSLVLKLKRLLGNGIYDIYNGMAFTVDLGLKMKVIAQERNKILNRTPVTNYFP